MPQTVSTIATPDGTNTVKPMSLPELDEMEQLYIREAERYLVEWEDGEGNADSLLAAQAAAAIAAAAGQRLARLTGR